MPTTDPEIPTPYAGANRIRCEGLRLPALSALARSPVVDNGILLPSLWHSWPMGSMVWRILGTGSALVAGIGASKIVDQIWKRSGQGGGVDPRNPNVPFRQAFAYAALTGLVAGTARTMATRKAAGYYQKSAGHLPAAMLPKVDKKAAKK